MDKDSDTQLFQAVFKEVCAFLACIAGDTYAAYIKSSFAEHVDQTEYVFVIGDAQVAAHFVFINIRSADHDYDLSLVAKLH